MTQHWTLALACDECGATVMWQDQRPEWHEDEERKAEIEQAIAWVKEHPEMRSGMLLEIEDKPRLVYRTLGAFGGWPEVHFVPTRYTRCPACDARIYIDQHSIADDADEETAEDEAVATAS